LLTIWAGVGGVWLVGWALASMDVTAMSADAARIRDFMCV
jgi:hypothetical protein